MVDASLSKNSLPSSFLLFVFPSLPSYHVYSVPFIYVSALVVAKAFDVLRRDPRMSRAVPPASWNASSTSQLRWSSLSSLGLFCAGGDPWWSHDVCQLQLVQMDSQTCLGQMACAPLELDPRDAMQSSIPSPHSYHPSRVPKSQVACTTAYFNCRHDWRSAMAPSACWQPKPHRSCGCDHWRRHFGPLYSH